MISINNLLILDTPTCASIFYTYIYIYLYISHSFPLWTKRSAESAH